MQNLSALNPLLTLFFDLGNGFSEGITCVIIRLHEVNEEFIAQFISGGEQKCICEKAL